MGMYGLCRAIYATTIQYSSAQSHIHCIHRLHIHTYIHTYIHTSYPSKLIERPHVELSVVIFEPELALIEEPQRSHLSSVEYQRATIGNVPDYKLIRIFDVKPNTPKKEEQEEEEH